MQMTICSSSEATWAFMIATSNNTTGTMPSCSPLTCWKMPEGKYAWQRLCCCLSSWQSNGDILSSHNLRKTSTCFSFKPSYSLHATSNEQFSSDPLPLWQSTSLSISHLVVKQVLGVATYHSTDYCPLTGKGRGGIVSSAVGQQLYILS